jgi:hypothetical protein
MVLLIFLASLCYGHATAQDYSKGGARPLFASHEMLKIGLRANFDVLLDDVGDDRIEHHGFLEYYDGNDTVVLQVKIKTRGNFRRDADNCTFPPLRINFKKKEVVGTVFEGMDKIKLVTHCRPNSKAYRQNVLSEYMVYRVFNILTDTSFRVRPAIIHYIDSAKGKNTQESYAFFIEPDEVLAERIGAEEIKQKYLMQDSTRYQHMSLLAVFQYFIGNTDWAVSTLHNIKLFVTDTLQPAYAIPYDFDWSGVVDAFYAAPQPRFELTSVTQRLFRGFCRSREELQHEFDYFKMKKVEIYEIHENCEFLTKRQRKDILNYYDDFYDIIENEAMIKLEFMDKCLSQDKF